MIARPLRREPLFVTVAIDQARALAVPNRRPTSPTVRAAMAAVLALAVPVAAGAATTPIQPAKGPGGSDYVATDVVKKAYGSGSAQAFVFRPAGPSEAARPIVVFVHAPGAISPKYYGAWIEHLARKGNIVVYPRYEFEIGKTKYSDMAVEAAKGVKEALAGLDTEAEVKLDRSKLAVVGHGGGAVIAANLAAVAAEQGLPSPRLVFGAMPAKPAAERGKGLPLADLSGLDPKTVLVMLVGDRDTVAGEGGGRQVIRAASGLPVERRLLVKVPSDNHGQPALAASHYAPVAPSSAYDLQAIAGALDQPGKAAPAGAAPRDKTAREQARKDAGELWRTGYSERQEMPNYDAQEVDAMDWYGLWRPFDLARDVVFAGGDAVALKRDGRLYDMGLWSDSWPVRRLNAESPKPEPPKLEAAPSPQAVSPSPPTKPGSRRPRQL